MNKDNHTGMGHSPNPRVPDIPEGLSVALMQDANARTYFQGLSDAQKTSVIEYIQGNNVTGSDAKNKLDRTIEGLGNNSLAFVNRM